MSEQHPEVIRTLYGRFVSSPEYNMAFSSLTGECLRFGKSVESDPTWCPFGPEILDLEIAVNGCTRHCDFCYKDNTDAPPTLMSVQTVDRIIHKLPQTVCQAALGITGARTHPDLFRIMRLLREHDIVPNFTVSGVDPEIDKEFVSKAAEYAGAVAVSIYPDKIEQCFRTAQRFRKAGIGQTNLHFVLSQQSLEGTFEVLSYLNAAKSELTLVLLGLKPKGRASSLSPVTYQQFQRVVDACTDYQIPLGFDSCSASKYIRWIHAGESAPWRREQLLQMVEPCESGLFSLYINVYGVAYPCSFAEKEAAPEIDVLNTSDFLSDVWMHPEMVDWRKRLLAGHRECPLFKLDEEQSFSL